MASNLLIHSHQSYSNNALLPLIRSTLSHATFAGTLNEIVDVLCPTNERAEKCIHHHHTHTCEQAMANVYVRHLFLGWSRTNFLSKIDTNQNDVYLLTRERERVKETSRKKNTCQKVDRANAAHFQFLLFYTLLSKRRLRVQHFIEYVRSMAWNSPNLLHSA